MSENSQIKLGKYQLSEKVEEGGMSEIFLAFNEVQQKVILKKLKKEFSHDRTFIKLLSSEVETLKLLNHPQIVKAYDFQSSGENTYAVLEYIDGYTLRQLIDKHDQTKKSWPLAIVLEIILQLCLALEHVHSANDSVGKPLNIVHSDLNPRNILLNKNGCLKLIDFSIAQTAENRLGSSEGVGRGVITYMSPEQAQGQEIDSRSDLFSVGILLFEMLVGEMPFAGKSKFEVYCNLLSKQIEAKDFPASLPQDAVHIIKCCLQKNKEDRYPSSSELSQALQELYQTRSAEKERAELAQYLSQF